MKINKLLPISLVIAMGIVDAKNQCFRPYNLNVVNKSGGVATLVNGKEVAGMVRGSQILNNRSKRLQVNDLGANITFEVGPEEQKQKARVSLYDTTGINPSIILEPKAIKAVDVNTVHGRPYQVVISNDSGGIATLTECSGKVIKIANGARTKISVYSSSRAHILAGREGNKRAYNIQFFEKTGENPMITLGGGEFFSSGIRSKDVNVRVNNAVNARLSTGLGPKKRHAAQPLNQQRAHMKNNTSCGSKAQKAAAAATVAQ